MNKIKSILLGLINRNHETTLTHKPDIYSTSELLRNNTGTSIKNWFIWGSLWLGAIILIPIPFLMCWMVVVNKVEINPSEIIFAVAGMFTGAGLPKIAEEVRRSEAKKNNIKKQRK